MSRLVISALAGGSGKTFVALGLARAFKDMGYTVPCFKKGPDYIDSAFLSQASGNSCTNLDPFFLDDKQLLQLYNHNYKKIESSKKIAVIEGNRAIFDGRDLQGSCSTAKLAKLLQAPVLLTLNCAKVTRTLAAIVKGIQAFDPDLNLAGVILNNVGSKRHAQTAREAIEYYTNIPVLGIIPRQEENPISERHMGLIYDQKDPKIEEAIEKVAKIIQASCDLEAMIKLAKQVPNLPETEALFLAKSQKPSFKLGVILDQCFWFYYPENLQALESQGAEIVYFSAFDEKIPQVDALYLGGGFPENFASHLEKSPILPQLKKLADQGLPIYAECGSLMLLCKELIIKEKTYKMAGVFDLSVVFHKKPHGLGYVDAELSQDNPYFKDIPSFKGHEFHYSTIQNKEIATTCLKLHSGQGIGNKSDGLVYKNTFASYTHIFAPAVELWARNFASLVR